MSLGELLFNECYLFFFGITLLLFISMIGSIVLALDKNIFLDSFKKEFKEYTQIY